MLPLNPLTDTQMGLLFFALFFGFVGGYVKRASIAKTLSATQKHFLAMVVRIATLIRDMLP